MHLGLMQHLQIKLGKQPSRDRDLETNAAVLDSLSQPFQAKLWGRNFQQDGSLDWSTPIKVCRATCGEQPELERWTPLLIPRDAIFNLVFGEVCSGYFFVVFFRASNHLERESDRANALTAPSSRL